MTSSYVNTPLPRPPLAHSGFTEVQRRVFYQLVVIDRRHYPARYEYPADGLRQFGLTFVADPDFVWVYWQSQAAAHSIARGVLFRDWRDQLDAVGLKGARHWAYRRDKPARKGKLG